MEGNQQLYIIVEETRGDMLALIWYKIPQESRPCQEELPLSSAFELQSPESHDLSAHAAVGPYIFVIGGTDYLQRGRKKRLYNDLYMMDTRDQEKGWKKGPDLLSARAESYAFGIGETFLCVLGSRWVNRHPYGEVLDLRSGKWKIFEISSYSGCSPPSTIITHQVEYDEERETQDFSDYEEENNDNRTPDSSEYIFHHFSPDNCRRCPRDLYVYDADALYSYDFQSATWKLVVEHLHQSERGAFVDGVLYLLSSKLEAYSLTRLKWFKNPVSGFETHPDALPPPDRDSPWLTPPSSLVHMGNGILCLLWTLPGTNTMKLHCTRFTVKTNSEDLSAVAKVLSFETYRLPPGRLLESLVVNTSSAISSPLME